MFTLYGNQYESREEHLLLTMFQVSGSALSCLNPTRLLTCPRSLARSLSCLLNSKPPPSLARSSGPTRPSLE